MRRRDARIAGMVAAGISPPRLTLDPWPEQFERDLSDIGLPKGRAEASRPRAFLYCRLRDMETKEAVLPFARQAGRLDRYFWLSSFEWSAIGYNLPRVAVWFTIGQRRITALLAYAGADERRGRALAVERARVIHGVSSMTLTETE